MRGEILRNSGIESAFAGSAKLSIIDLISLLLEKIFLNHGYTLKKKYFVGSFLRIVLIFYDVGQDPRLALGSKVVLL